MPASPLIVTGYTGPLSPGIQEVLRIHLAKLYWAPTKLSVLRLVAGDVKLLRHKISRNLSTEVRDMKLETKDGWFKRRVGEERKTKGGGIGSVHNNKKKPLHSVNPSGTTGASPSPRIHFLASVSHSLSFRALHVLPRGTGNS